MIDSKDYILVSNEVLSDALQEIEDLKQQLQTAKEALPKKVLELLSNAPTRDEADALAWSVYWEFDAIPTTVLSEFYRMPISYARQIIGGAVIPTPCHTCGKIENKVFDSRNAYKNAIGTHSWAHKCDECKSKESQVSEQWKIEYQKRTDAFNQRVADLRAMPYRDYLETDHWKDIRKQMLKRAHFSCQLCSAKGELHVHHRTYENRGNEQYGDLIVLCANCHAKFHDKLEN